MYKEIYYPSLFLQKNIKPIFDSFEIKTKDEKKHITINLSTRDVYDLKNKKTLWFGNKEKAKYLYIKTVCIQDKNIFDLINNENYLEILEKTKNNFIYNTTNINDFFEDKKKLSLENLEFSNLKGLFYKFSYKINIEVPMSNFISFITYMYFDYKQYFLDKGKNVLSIDVANKGFTIDKFVLLNDKIKNNIIERVATIDNKLWLGSYKEEADKLTTKVENSIFELKKISHKLKIIDFDIFKKINPSSIFIDNKIDDQNFNFMSFIGDVHTAVDQNGDLKIHFPLDLMNSCSKYSSIFKYINTNKIDDITLESIKVKTNIKKTYVVRTNLSSKDTITLSAVFNKNMSIMTSDDKNSLSNIGLMTITDEDIKAKPPSKYSYEIFFKIEDGYKKYLDEYIKFAKMQLSKYSEYYTFCIEQSSKIDKNKNYINYDFTKNTFTKKFIDEQNLNNSMWKKCLDAPVTYLKLFYMLEKDTEFVPVSDVILMISTSNASLETLGMFQELFVKLINKAEKINQVQQNVIIEGQTSLLKEFNSYNNSNFYDYFDSFKLNINDVLSNNKNGCFLQPKKIIKIQSSNFYDKIIKSNILEGTLQQFKISQQSETLLVNNIKETYDSQHKSSTLIPYELLSNYNELLYNKNEKKFIAITLEQYKNILLSTPLVTLKATYEMLCSNSIFIKNNLTTKEEYSAEILNILKNYATFLYDFFTTYAKNDICKNYKKMMLFSILYGKIVKIEYLDGFKKDNSGLLHLKQPTWKLFDFKDSRVSDIILSKKSLFIRLTPLDLSALLFLNDTKTNLEIINKYAIIG